MIITVENQEPFVKVICSDALEALMNLESECIDCVVTSPPYYGMRDYKIKGQIGLEPTPDEYVDNVVEVFQEVKRVLKSDGTAWLNLGDGYVSKPKGNAPNNPGLQGHSYGDGKSMLGYAKRNDAYKSMKGLGYKDKNLIGIPWRVVFGLQMDGWYLRSNIIWSKPVHTPDPANDRPQRTHENIFLLSKSRHYHFDMDALSWMGANKTVWEIRPVPATGFHSARFPDEIPRRCILSGSRPGDTVLDPFAGSGTTGLVAKTLKRNSILVELNPDYAEIIKYRLTTSPNEWF